MSLTYTARVAPGPGVSSDVVQTAIETALANAFPTFPVGGFNQTAGAGSIGVDLLELVAGRSHPAIYKVRITVTVPGAGDVALAPGDVATLTSAMGSVVVA